MTAAEHIERQITVAIVVAMEEAAFLMAVQRIVGGVEVEHDLGRRRCVGFEEQVHQQALDCRAIVGDLVIARGRGARQFQPVQRRFARHRRAVPPLRRKLAGQQRHDRIAAQRVVVVQILIAQGQPEHPLAHQRRDLVFDQVLHPAVLETTGKARDQTDRPVGGPQKQRARIGRGDAAVESSRNFPLSKGCKTERFRVTLCRHRGTPVIPLKALSQNHFR
jgi:hypothetical protein